MHGGDWVAEVLQAQGVQFVFTLTGGHIAPILVGCKERGIRVVDTRHEVNAVFAADAVARLSGVPGVVVVTAGPGVTNTLTAVKNAQMAQSPVIIIGGAAATVLQGRGALQDIDQLSLFKSVVKWTTSVRRIKDIVPTLEQAFYEAQSGTPGPVFVEMPIDLLYQEDLVRDWYGIRSGGRTLAQKAVQFYLRYHLRRLFGGVDNMKAPQRVQPDVRQPRAGQVRKVAAALSKAERPVLLVGSQVLLAVDEVNAVAAAIEHLGIPVYLSGMARGLLGRSHPLQMRHKRSNALREADLVILAGVPLDFRLDYGNKIRHSAVYISANRSRDDLTQNRRPTIGVHGDPGAFLRQLAEQMPAGERWTQWKAALRERNDAREQEIQAQALEPVRDINPLHLFQELEQLLPPNAILVADGGDFVATGSYILNPRGPLTWLDPGPFGTLGVGAGFALGAKLVRPDAEVWIIYGDGSVGFSLAEFDTFTRHNIPVIALVGNDAGWTQIARDQVEFLKDDVATTLTHADYHRAAEGLGAKGLRVRDPELASDVLQQARTTAAEGRPVLVNAIIGTTDFRKGSISV